MNCPECGQRTVQEMVDVGVGSIPCGPRECPSCFWSEPYYPEDTLLPEADTAEDTPRP